MTGLPPLMPSELTRDAGHVYRLDGRVVPGVTQVLNLVSELDGIPRAVLAAAAEFGQHVHQATDLFDRGTLDIETLDPKLAPYLAAWQKFLADSRVVIVSSESFVHHPALGYAGQRDRRVLFPESKLPHTLDIKTSALMPRTVGPQTAAYRECDLHRGLESSPVRYCVHLKADATYRLHRLTDRADFSIFVSCLNIWRFLNAH